MAIKTSSQGLLPAVNLDYLQYSEFNMRVSEVPPHTIALSAKLRPYGMADGLKYYAKDSKNLNIVNLDAYVGGLAGAQRTEAQIALMKVQEGLGVLAALYFNVDFMGVE
jgi:hypothetical protein